MFRKIILILFFLSGIAALIYEVVWMRVLTIIFGTTTFAVSTVLSVFMGGLAAGSFFWGRLSGRLKFPLLNFAFLEIGIGLYSFFIPFLLRSLMKFYPELYASPFVNFMGFGLIRFFICFFILIIPTFLMGGTLPVVTKFYAARPEQLNRDVSLLYGVNTLGAVMGAILSGFILLYYFGVSATIFITSALNILIGIFIFFLQRIKYARETEVAARQETEFYRPPIPYSNISSIIPWFSLASGFASFVYQVSFTRALSLFFGTSVYAISTMLCAFILGLAIGSFMVTRLSKNNSNVYLFGLSQLRIALGATLFLAVYIKSPAAFVWFHSFLHNKFWLFQLSQFLIIVLVMLYPTVWMGVSFPVAVSIYSQDKMKIGRDIGILSAFNTLGCLLGSLAGGFLLIPTIGVQHSIILAIIVNVTLGILALLFIRQPQKWRQPILGMAMIAVIIWLRPAWDKGVLVSGYYARLFTHRSSARQKPALLNEAKLNPKVKINTNPLLQFSDQEIFSPEKKEKVEVIYYKEGINSTIAVLRQDKNRTLMFNGKADASTFEVDLKTQFLLGYIPLLLHRKPSAILVIGLGSGCTVGTFITYPGIKQIDCVEIEPAVIEASKYFAPENNYFYYDPRVKIIVDDARSFILTTNERYDIISSEPSNLYMGGVSNLFTKEHFQACRQKMKKDGIMCQWVHAYQISYRDLGVIFNTFQSVFKHTLLFSNADSLILIGSQEEINTDLEKLESQWSSVEVKAQLKAMGIDSIKEIMKFKGYGNMDMAALIKGAALNTDDHPVLEFSVPKSQY